MNKEIPEESLKDAKICQDVASSIYKVLSKRFPLDNYDNCETILGVLMCMLTYHIYNALKDDLLEHYLFGIIHTLIIFGYTKSFEGMDLLKESSEA